MSRDLRGGAICSHLHNQKHKSKSVKKKIKLHVYPLQHKLQMLPLPETVMPTEAGAITLLHDFKGPITFSIVSI